MAVHLCLRVRVENYRSRRFWRGRRRRTRLRHRLRCCIAGLEHILSPAGLHYDCSPVCSGVVVRYALDTTSINADSEQLHPERDGRCRPATLSGWREQAVDLNDAWHSNPAAGLFPLKVGGEALLLQSVVGFRKKMLARLFFASNRHKESRYKKAPCMKKRARIYQFSLYHSSPPGGWAGQWQEEQASLRG